MDGTNVTCQDAHMWLIPFAEGEGHSLTLTFPSQTMVAGVRVWNYNKSPEDTYRGVCGGPLLGFIFEIEP